MNETNEGLYILLLSIHGLIRGHDLELGRDADTGGQTKYVIELLRALDLRPEISKVELLTRRIDDEAVSDDYKRESEIIGERSRIVRIDCGEDRYLAKEELWDCLDSYADNTIEYLHAQERPPDIIHAHYADAGYVGTRLSHHFDRPLIFTGHSLGRTKRKRLLATGMRRDDIEERYNISRRIDAEEDTLGTAVRVITSTNQEINEQYAAYDFYDPDRMVVLPPGTDLDSFHPPESEEKDTSIAKGIYRFLKDPGKPMILALSRPDQRKNITTLIKAFGDSQDLQRLANLVIIAGNRDDIRDLDTGAQEVLTDILLNIDRYDLYGKVAYPKHHSPSDVATIYRLASSSGGVFINPALTEPFGLTLIEAAASGVPLVATEDGGPRDIIGNCENGMLVDPLNQEQMAQTLIDILSDTETWKRYSQNGIEGVREHYSWSAHAERYMELIEPVASTNMPINHAPLKRRPMLYHDRAIFSDLDQNLLGNPESLGEFIEMLDSYRRYTTFGIATGRRLDSALAIMKKYSIPRPDVLITSLGTEIYYNPGLAIDEEWSRHIDHLWNRKMVISLLNQMPGLEFQPKSEQSKYKISYYYDVAKAPGIDEINSLLHQLEQTVNLNLSFGQFLDVTPVRATKGFAIRWFADMWGIELENILAAGGSGADEDMMRGNMRSVVVANRHHEELSELVDVENIFFASKPFASGIIEAIDHYDFFGDTDREN